MCGRELYAGRGHCQDPDERADTHSLPPVFASAAGNSLANDKRKARLAAGFRPVRRAYWTSFTPPKYPVMPPVQNWSLAVNVPLKPLMAESRLLTVKFPLLPGVLPKVQLYVPVIVPVRPMVLTVPLNVQRDCVPCPLKKSTCIATPAPFCETVSVSKMRIPWPLLHVATAPPR